MKINRYTAPIEAARCGSADVATPYLDDFPILFQGEVVLAQQHDTLSDSYAVFRPKDGRTRCISLANVHRLCGARSTAERC